MASSNGNILTQELQQIQTLSPQQVLQVRLLEMPVQELEQRIHKELLDNEALEKGEEESEALPTTEDENAEEENFNLPEETVLRDPEDDYEPSIPRQKTGKEEPSFEQLPISSDESFFDLLMKQIGEFEVSEQQRNIIEYLIGSLDDDGLLRKETWKIADELTINWNMDTDEKDVEECIGLLQQFDPAGVGARSLQECLLLQIDRKENDPLQPIKHLIIAECYQEFTHKSWDKIATRLGVEEKDLSEVRAELAKLNPKPGISLGESGRKNFETIIPDFLVTLDDDGSIHLFLNNDNIPQLHISQSFSDTLNEFTRNKEKMSKSTRESLTYIKNKIDNAQGFITAIKSRQSTMLRTMQSIIYFQKQFFLDGDDLQLKPLTMRDVAERAKVDLSTVSRVCNNKYVDTPYGIFPLKHFFGDSYQTSSGEDVATRIIRSYLKEVIDNEDKSQPYTDEQLAAILKEKGYNVARRTVAKYRDQLDIPIARFRK